MSDDQRDDFQEENRMREEQGLPERPPVDEGDPMPTFGDPSQWTEPVDEPGQTPQSQWTDPGNDPDYDEQWDIFWNGTWKRDRERRKAQQSGQIPEGQEQNPEPPSMFGLFGGDEQRMRTATVALGFDWQAFLLVILWLIPQAIWLAVPAPNDLLRDVGAVGMVEVVGSGFSMIAFLTMCTLVNPSENGGRRYLKADFKNGYAILALLCMVGFLATWWLYYQGHVEPIVMALNAALPLLAFVLHLFMRRNWVSLLPMTVFVVCQLASSFSNYVIG